MRVALYMRVSTEDQVEGFSLDNQSRRLEQAAVANAWSVVGRYVDEGKSGRSINRPAYQKMMGAIDTWDAVVVVKMDRIHRNTRNFADMMDLMSKRGKQFLSLSETFDTTTAMGRFVMEFMQGLAQFESAQTGERVYQGMKEKVLQGPAWLAPKPFGYRLEGGSLVPDEATAPWLRKVFGWYVGGLTSRTIAQALTDQGVRTARGGPWTQGQVISMLTNRTYVGERNWDNHVTPAHHPALVSEDIFKAAEDRRRENRKRPDG